MRIHALMCFKIWIVLFLLIQISRNASILRSSTVHKMMTTLLKRCKGVLCYIENVIVYSKSEAEHTANLREVQHHIADAGLQLKGKLKQFRI